MMSKLNGLRLNQIKQFCSITIDKSTALNNQKYGIAVLGYYGMLTIKNTQCNENETDGMVFAKNANDSSLFNQNDMGEDEA